MSLKLETSAQIIRYIQGLSNFIDEVKITDVYPGGFIFRVKVPLWYKFMFGNKLWKTIQQNLSARVPMGISFKFEIYSESFF